MVDRVTSLAEASRDQRKVLETDMIIVMKADASPEQVLKVAEQVEGLGLKPHVIEGQRGLLLLSLVQKKMQP